MLQSRTRKEGGFMPQIRPIKDLWNINARSDVCHAVIEDAILCFDETPYRGSVRRAGAFA